MLNSLDPDQSDVLSGLTFVQTVYKYQSRADFRLKKFCTVRFRNPIPQMGKQMIC